MPKLRARLGRLELLRLRPRSWQGCRATIGRWVRPRRCPRCGGAPATSPVPAAAVRRQPVCPRRDLAPAARDARGACACACDPGPAPRPAARRAGVPTRAAPATVAGLPPQRTAWLERRTDLRPAAAPAAPAAIALRGLHAWRPTKRPRDAAAVSDRHVHPRCALEQSRRPAAPRDARSGAGPRAEPWPARVRVAGHHARRPAWRVPAGGTHHVPRCPHHGGHPPARRDAPRAQLAHRGLATTDLAAVVVGGGRTRPRSRRRAHRRAHR